MENIFGVLFELCGVSNEKDWIYAASTVQTVMKLPIKDNWEFMGLELDLRHFFLQS